MKHVSIAFIWLAIFICVLSPSLNGSALEPLQCPVTIHAAVEATEGPGDKPLIAVHVLNVYAGDEYDEQWSYRDKGSPDVLSARSKGGAQSIELKRADVPIVDFSRSWVTFYTNDEAEADLHAGEWVIQDDHGVEGVFHVLPALEKPIHLQDELHAEIVIPPPYMWYDSSEELRKHSLYASVMLPRQWEAWYPGVQQDMLFVVRVSLDGPPDTGALRETDRVSTVFDGEIVVARVSGDCFLAGHPIIDWMDAETLYGLVWPLGADPEQISLRFERDLADLQEEAIRTIDADDTEEDSAENKDEDGDDLTAKPKGCQSSSVTSTPLLALALFGILVGVRRRRTV